QNRFIWRRIQNAFWSRLPESPNPRQCVEQRNLVCSHFLDRSINAFAWRIDSNGMNLSKLVRRHKFIKAGGWRLDSLFARRQTHANQKQRHTSSDQEHGLNATPDAQEAQRSKNRKPAHKERDEPSVNENCAN